jgi:hypothetical protein
MIRRTLRLAKSLIAAAIAATVLPPIDAKRARDAGPAIPGFLVASRQPEVARPPVSWWLLATHAEKLEMRRELRKKLGRDPADLQRRFFSRMASLKKLVRQVQLTHERLYARYDALHRQYTRRPVIVAGHAATEGDRPRPPEVAQELAALAAEMHELSGVLAKYQIRLQHLRVLARRQHESNARRAAQQRALKTLDATGKALADPTDGHPLGMR